MKVECRNESDTSNNRGKWNHFKIVVKYLSNVRGKHEIKELQETAILDAAHILREVTGESIRRISCEIIFRIPYTLNMEELQHYTPLKNGFFYIILNNFYIGGNE